MTSTTANINNLVQIDESFQLDSYDTDYIICHCNYPIIDCLTNKEVQKYAVALGPDSSDYHETDYDPTLDYDSIGKFIGVYGNWLVKGYGLEREKVYKVNNITFKIDKQKVDKDTYNIDELVLKVIED